MLLKVTNDFLLLDQALQPICSGSFCRFSLRGGINATKGLQHIKPDMGVPFFWQGKETFLRPH